MVRAMLNCAAMTVSWFVGFFLSIWGVALLMALAAFAFVVWLVARVIG